QSVTLTLTVVERYQDADSQGLPVQREHRVSRTAEIRVHDSVKEIGDMARAFLIAFSEQVGTTETLKDFSRTCDGGAGYEDELFDVKKNLEQFTIRAYRVDQPAVTFAFAARPSCLPRPGINGDACAATFVRWEDTEISTGKEGIVEGTSYVSAVYEDSRWLLCHSGFEGRNLLTGLRVIR
ncbi:MAG TPA: hypothetical protein VMN81_08145, partial [Vicinamibacterales bacterium]|nr:hypothetical protein [Vicinamibacterales bacterium]